MTEHVAPAEVRHRHDDAEASPGAAAGALAGMLAAGAALATGEVVSGFTDTVPSLVVAVAELLVDDTPGAIVRWSIETFGGNQKTIVQVGITAVAVVIGAVLGIVGRRPGRRSVATAGFLAFGLLGGWAAARNPQSSAFGSWFTAAAATVVGVVALRFLWRAATRDRSTPADADVPLARRAFLATGAGAAIWTVVGVALGRSLRSSRSVAGARDEVATQLDDPGATSLEGIETFDDISGISPVVTPNDDFYRIDTAIRVPQVDPADWQLRITGLVDNELTFTFDELLAMDQIEGFVTLSCVSNEVGGGLVGNAHWTGVPLAHLLELAGVRPEAEQVVGRSVDDFTAGFPIEVALDGRPTMVALTMNGEPLPIDHGFPARLVVPGLYGYVSATKWLSSIELTTWDGFDGYWIPRGWGKEGPIKTQSRIDVPRPGEQLAAGRQAIAGVAWAPHRGIAGVEVRIDDGEWQAAELAEVLSDNAWVQWKYAWDATPGEHRISVRATDGDGETQTAEEQAPAPDGATGHHRVTVDVS